MVPAMHKVIVVTVVLPISTALITGITEVINTPGVAIVRGCCTTISSKKSNDYLRH
jgi:hypothetical protein